MLLDSMKGFNIPVDEMGRAVRFHRSVFGWSIDHVQGSEGNFLGAQTTDVDEGGEPVRPGAINGGLFVRGTHGLTDTFLEVRVSSIDDCLEKVTAGGGTIIRPKTRMLDFAYFAVVRDSEGNAIGLWENIKE